MARVQVYTAASCPFCVRAKRLLEARGVPFDEIDVGSDLEARADLVRRTGRPGGRRRRRWRLGGGWRRRSPRPWRCSPRVGAARRGPGRVAARTSRGGRASTRRAVHPATASGAAATGRRRPPSSPSRGTSATTLSGTAARASSSGWRSSRASPAPSWRPSRGRSPQRRSTTSSPTSRPSGPRAAETRLVVMAKHPVPGRVKTRLAAALGADTACALYRAFVLDLAERLGGLPYAVTWAYTPPDA